MDHRTADRREHPLAAHQRQSPHGAPTSRRRSALGSCRTAAWQRLPTFDRPTQLLELTCGELRLSMPHTRRHFLEASLVLAVGNATAQVPERVIVGTYNDAKLWALKSLTFPRVLLYRHDGSLVEREQWPNDLRLVKDQAGDAFCCVSDKPIPLGHIGPPPDCKVVVYGENVEEHFDGLRASNGTLITRSSLPRHEYLVVEYYASWCGPCKPAREALSTFFKQSASTKFVAVVVDFSRRTGVRPTVS